MRHRAIFLTILTALSILFHPINGKVFARCDAVKELQRGGISRTYMSSWICLMQNVSGFKTDLVTGPKQGASYSYGVFQISSFKWCARGRQGGVCNKKCEDFSNDDIQDDIVCAKKIFDTEGFKYWDGWVKGCKNKPLPDISNCRRRRSSVFFLE